MSIDIEKLIRLNKLISVHFRKKHIIDKIFKKLKIDFKAL